MMAGAPGAILLGCGLWTGLLMLIAGRFSFTLCALAAAFVTVGALHLRAVARMRARQERREALYALRTTGTYPMGQGREEA